MDEEEIFKLFAMALAHHFHRGQVDKSGKPYYDHVLAVANGVETDKEKTVAFLHDMVEDTEFTMADVRQLFPDDIATSVDYLTRRSGETYKDFINRVKDNSMAVEVKLSDLRHNMDISRIDNPTPKDYRRLEKYKLAYEELRAARRN